MSKETPISENPVFVGIDVGGTFTDLVMFDSATRRLRTVKVPSSPPDFWPSVIKALEEAGLAQGRTAAILHGTTVHLNAFLERKGAKTALLTTDGFRDIYEMRRGNRPQAYNLHFQYPAPLVPRKHIVEIRERTLADGEILTPADLSGLADIARELTSQNIKAVAICFLHSYRNPENEKRVLEALKPLVPGIFVSSSHEICREWREFERTSTAIINAYVSPVLKNYLDQLSGALADWRETRLFLLQSNGGLISAREAATKGVLTLLSGPVGGNVACRAISTQGTSNLIGIDMGGTSFEASLVVEGSSAIRHEREVGGFPVLAPMVDIHTIGAGGGSIAWEESGALRVGPHSAAARPGPAAYGLGGTEATVTDANVVLGRLRDGTSFGRDLTLKASLARDAVARFGKKFGLSAEAAAQGILDVINEQMANAIRTITIRRGIDPRHFALVAYGGAGPMHAADIARLLGIKTIIVPHAAGAFSAWGMLQSDLVHDRAISKLCALRDLDWDDADRQFKTLEAELGATLVAEGVAPEDIEVIRSLDIRYEGQEYSISVPLPPGFLDCYATPADRYTSIDQKFGTLYQKTYGHSNPGENLQVSTLRLRAVGHTRLSVTDVMAASRALVDEAIEETISPVLFNGQSMPTRFLGRSALRSGETVPGPLVVLESTATTIVPPDFSATLDDLGNLVLTQGRSLS